jgi:hypothetical protein
VSGTPQWCWRQKVSLQGLNRTHSGSPNQVAVERNTPPSNTGGIITWWHDRSCTFAKTPDTLWHDRQAGFCQMAGCQLNSGKKWLQTLDSLRYRTLLLELVNPLSACYLSSQHLIHAPRSDIFWKLSVNFCDLSGNETGPSVTEGPMYFLQNIAWSSLVNFNYIFSCNKMPTACKAEKVRYSTRSKG